jgi:transposase InsO family protein
MPWSVRSVIENRKHFCIDVLESGVAISSACRIFGISRKTGYKWLNRYRQKGVEGLVDQSRRPRSSPERLIKNLEKRIVKMKRLYPYWGPRKIHRLASLECEAIKSVSVSTVSRVLARYGLVTPREEPIIYPVVGRFERSLPNELWQMDLKVAVRHTGNSRIYVAGLLDDYSRYALGLWFLHDLTDESVLSCWISAVRRYGMPDQTLTDHGAQFRMEDNTTSAFRTYLWACKVRHIQGRIGHPQTQGKIERFWRTFQHELTPQLESTSSDRWPALMERWREQYNTIRPHESLADSPPASRYHPSDKPYIEPDRQQRIGRSDSLYRHVSSRGLVSLGGQLHMVGRGLRGWIVEIRSQGNGCWHVYFQFHFIREIILTKPNKCVTHVPVQM